MQREKLLLLPGMMCDERLFAPQVSALSGEVEIVVPRLCGASTIDGLARIALAAAGSGPLNVAGLSMGGIVAMAILAIAPGQVKRLALLDTNHFADAPERRSVRNRQIADVRAGRLRQVIVDEMKPNYLATSNRTRTDLLDLLVEMAMDLGPEVFVEQSLALRDRRSHEDALPAFKGPALVLCGSEDLLCPPQRHREIAALLPKPQYVEIPGAGHISTLERPDAVTKAMEKWLVQHAMLAAEGPKMG
jgi:pimeloyl-ACP methyl ester carboxylesterase